MIEGPNNTKEEIDLLVEKFRKLISPGPSVPEDFTYFIRGDTLFFSSDRISGDNLSRDISKTYGVLKLSEDVKNAKIIDNKVYAELCVPSGNVSKIELELEKYKV